MESVNYITDAPLDGENCDGCGETAIVRVVLSNGGTLVFCPTCWERNEDALRNEATHVRG